MIFQPSGVWTIERAEELRNTLLKFLDAGDGVEISFVALEEADLTFFQLIHAARLSFRDRGISLSLRADLPAGLDFKAVQCGLGHLVVQ